MACTAQGLSDGKISRVTTVAPFALPAGTGRWGCLPEERHHRRPRLQGPRRLTLWQDPKINV